MAIEAPNGATDILLEIALEFGKTLDLERLLPLVLDKVTNMFGAERALFALYDINGQLERAVVHNLSWGGPGQPLPVSKGLIERVLKTEDVLLIPDAQTHESFRKRGSIQEMSVRFMVGIPVHIEGRASGVLCVDSRSKGDPTSREVQLLTALAKLVGTAVENAQMFEDQLFRTRLLDQLIHDFRTPLSVITVNAGLLAQVNDPDSEEAHEMALDIAASAQRMAQMVENTLELSRIEAGEMTPSPVSFDTRSEIIRHLQTLEVVARPLDLKIRPSVPIGLPPALTVPDWVWIVLDSLLFNALKHSFRGTTIKISATRREDRGPREALNRPINQATNLFRRMRALVPVLDSPFIEISVENRGPSIPTDLVPVLFSPFVQRATGAGKFRRTGLGLVLVDQCIRYLGGSVWLRKNEGETIAFAFTLPTEIEGISY